MCPGLLIAAPNYLLLGPIMDNPNIDANKTCYNCGKTFHTPTDLLRHKKRKTPCLIREISEADKNNPLRCIYCNKIFSKPSHLTRHHGVCKIKNGGLQTLHDKVKYEENLRVMQEEQDKKNKDMEFILTQMRADIEALRAENKELREAKQPTPELAIGNVGVNNGFVNNGFVNGNVNTINNTINIAVNNFDKPKLDHLRNFQSWTFEDFARLFNHELAGTPLALVEKIWYDPAHPENRSLHLVNKKNGETLIIIDGRWVTDNISRVIPIVRHIVYELTQGMITDNYARLVNFSNDMAPGFINFNHSDSAAMKRDAEEILQKMVDGRVISQTAVDSSLIAN